MTRFAVLIVLLGGCRSEARERVIPLVATAEVKGTTEPCGCNSDPLGGIGRIAQLAKGGLLLDAGNLLYDPELLRPEKVPQADLKADALATIYKDAPVGLGADDLARGAARVKPPRQACNRPGSAPPRIYTVEGVKIGVFGVTRVEGAGDPLPAAKQAVASLKGADVIVALLTMPRLEARNLLKQLDGVWFGVVGAEVGEGMAEPEPVGNAFLVAPADQGRRVAKIELHVLDGKPKLVMFGGEAERQRQLERAHKRVAVLGQQLAAWKKDPSADPAFVAAREKELKDLQAEQARLEKEKPVAPRTSYVSYALVPVKRALPQDARVEAELKELDKRIGAANFAAAQHQAAPEGEPHYVGMDKCEKCHKPEVAFWKHTVHAQAWKTLVDVNKQYNYDCTGCHVTGLGKPGGVTLATAEKRGLTNVQCEVCHGPASKHVEEAGLDDPKTLTLRPAENFCADNCHTPEHSDTFQLVPYLRDVTGKGHGEKLRAQLGEGVTGHELRQKALQAAGRR
jgi:hypothetical protein